MRLDLRNAANSLQIEGKGGVLPGDPYHWGGDLAVGRRDRIYIYNILLLFDFIEASDCLVFICLQVKQECLGRNGSTVC